MPHITVLVSNDLEHDQRVSKVCASLQKFGYDILLVGRMLPSSRNFSRPYAIRRLRLPFSKGAMFYASLNLRLFFFLLRVKTDAILANDLDTLFPAFLAARFRGKKLFYDSHEYFTEAEGLTGRNFQKRSWLLIENYIFPKLKNVYTVNASIAGIYEQRYGVPVRVVRNVPELKPLNELKTRSQLGLPVDKKIMLLQGAFIDPDRGAAEAVLAMKYLENVLLLIIGAGREMDKLKELVTEHQLEKKVWIRPKMSFDELRQYTANVDLGLSLDKPVHLNYKYSLPNKLFDYIHACIPILASDLPEIRKVFDGFEIGLILTDHNPEVMAETMRSALDHERRVIWKKNLANARLTFNWQNEEKVLEEIYKK